MSEDILFDTDEYGGRIDGDYGVDLKVTTSVNVKEVYVSVNSEYGFVFTKDDKDILADLIKALEKGIKILEGNMTTDKTDYEVIGAELCKFHSKYKGWKLYRAWNVRENHGKMLYFATSPKNDILMSRNLSGIKAKVRGEDGYYE